MSDERLTAAIAKAKDQIKHQRADYERLLNQIETLEAAARGAGELDLGLLNATHAQINQAVALLRVTDRGAGTAGAAASGSKTPATPLAELRQVLVDLKSARS